MTHVERLDLFDEADLYVVITQGFCAGRSSLDVLDSVLAAGVKLVQFREKSMDDKALYEFAQKFRERTAAAGALLIIDDRLDIALAVGADGIHLGQFDLPVSVARQLAPDLIIGASTHSLEQALAAQNAGASYINLGPIFQTQTKEVTTGPLGPELIDAVRPHIHIPFTCMGGIKAHNIEEVLNRGARHVAVVTAVTEADDVAAAATNLRDAIHKARDQSLPASAPQT
jgi:thiamine-phosphate pyrophosphorylase